MATLLESGLLESFEMIFALIFVVAITYGILTLTKVFGNNKGVYGVIALVLRIFVLIIPEVTDIILTMTPWFVMFFIFLVFVIIGYKIFGATDADITAAVKDRAVIWVILIVCVLIIIGAFASVFGQRLLTGDLSPGGQVGVDSGRTIIDAQTGQVIRGDGRRAASSSRTGSRDYAQNVFSTIMHPKVLGFGLIGLISLFTIAILSMESRPS